MDYEIIKHIVIGVLIALMTTLGVKISDIKVIEYRIQQVEVKVDKIAEKLGVN